MRNTQRLNLITNGYNCRVRSVAEDLTVEQVGEACVANGMITAEQLDWARLVQEQTGARLSVVLITSGLVQRYDLFQVMAEVSHVPFIDLVKTPPEPGVLSGLDAGQLIREGWVPVRELDDGRVLVALAHGPRREFIAPIEQSLGRPVAINVTTDWDIRRALQSGLREEILDRAALGLWRRDAAQSARQPVSTAADRAGHRADPARRLRLAVAVGNAPGGERDDRVRFPDQCLVQVRRLHGGRAAGALPGGR
jgi:hypothetical protein